MRSNTRGLIAAITAFGFWGFTPLYWSRLAHVPALELILHRIWWSFPLLWIIVPIQLRRSREKSDRPDNYGDTENTHRAFPRRLVMISTTVAGVLVTANWLTYVWAITHGRTLEASLGYYINPLVSVALGTVVLREKLDRLQAIAVGAAAAGVLYLTVRLGSLPWVSLILAVSFGVYGLIKKRVPVGATHSLALELIPLAPPALVAIVVGVIRGSSALFSVNWLTSALLIGAGAVTVVPLLLFGYAARHIRLSDVGFIQYIAPTSMLLLGIFAFGEVLDLEKLPGFVLVWVALVLYSISSIIRSRIKS